MHAVYQNDSLFNLDPNLKGPFFISIVFHLVVITAMSVGLPYITEDRVVSAPIPIEIVEIDEMTTTNKVAPPKPKLPEAEPEKPSPPVEREVVPQMVEETPPDLVTPQAPEIEEVPPPPPPEPEKVEEKPAEKPKPKPKPPEPKKEITKKVEEKKDFQSLLKNLVAEPEASAEDPAATETNKPSDVSQIAMLSERLTMSEEDALRRQLGQCWNVPAGAKFAEDLIVEVRVIVNRDRTVQQATILDTGRYNRDSYYRAAADAAIRALRNPKCTPLALPADKYEQWKTTIITFNPSEML